MLIWSNCKTNPKLIIVSPNTYKSKGNRVQPVSLFPQQNGQPLNAARAAYTFLEKHPRDDTMLDNMKYYKQMRQVTDDKIVSYEPVVHQEHYFAGAKLYERGYWQEAIGEFEVALKEYYQAHSRCQMLCEEEAERNQILGRGGLFGVHVSVIECRTKCPESLVTVKGSKVPSYLARHYNYLQMSYFKSKLYYLKFMYLCRSQMQLVQTRFHLWLPTRGVLGLGLRFSLSAWLRVIV